MAVYTQLSESDIVAFLSGYDVGRLVSFKGIAEGVSNTNYLLSLFPPPLRDSQKFPPPLRDSQKFPPPLRDSQSFPPLLRGRAVEDFSSLSFLRRQESNLPSDWIPAFAGMTDNTHYILTLFEKNFNAADLPFFMNLTEHLADKNITCPHPIHNNDGRIIGNIKGKPAVLIEFLEGRGNPHITTKHLELVGELVARLHLATQDFAERRENSLSLVGLQKIFASFRSRADEITVGLESEIENEFGYLEKNFPKNLPAGIIHSDIFPDNVFFIDGNTDQPELSGIIDFYFSCYDFYMYDLMIVLNAWCFDSAHKFVQARADALFAAYNKIRLITAEEKSAMPVLARAAAMRFLITRSAAWLNRTDGALVNVKDPMEYVKKLDFHKTNTLSYV